MLLKPYGVLPAMVTPIHESGDINESALRKLVDFLINGGVHGIFATGTTGEFYALSNSQYRQVLEIAKDQSAGRVPLYAGANSITTKGSVELAEIASTVGVDALSVLTPMFIGPSQKELVEYYSAISSCVDTPIVIYNNPPKTGASITAETVEQLATIKNIVGIKDSSGDMTLAGEFIRRTREYDFEVMMGRDTMIYAGLCYGASGAIAACANVAPALVSSIYKLYKAGDHKGALEAQYKLAPLRIAFSMGTFPAVIKESLQLIGIDAGPCFAPVGPLTREEKEKLKGILLTMGVLR